MTPGKLVGEMIDCSLKMTKIKMHKNADTAYATYKNEMTN